MSLHRIHEHRNQRFQAFATNAIGCFPKHRQRLAHRLVVQTVAGARRLLGGALVSKQPYGVLAVVAGHGYELVEFLDPITECCTAISPSQRFDQLLAMLIRLVTSNCSRRTIRRVADYVRQRVSTGSKNDESMRLSIIDVAQTGSSNRQHRQK